jgi:hypothetical protein
VFNYNVLDIKSVEVTQPDSAQHNFKIVANGKNNFSMFSNGNPLIQFDTTRVRDYLLSYEKIHFENHNYEYKQKDVDSLRKVTPNYIIEVYNKKGVKNRITIYRRRYNYQKLGLDGSILEWDQDRCWVFLNDGRLVVGQYFVFDRLLRNKDWFLVTPASPAN